MGTQLNTWQRVEAPVATPYRFGLFSAVTPRLETDPHWRIGVQWQSQNCTTVKETTGNCIDEDVPALTPDNICSVMEYDPFTLYAYNDASVGGASLDEHRQNAVTRLTNGEQLAAEKHLLGLLTAAVPAPVALTYSDPATVLAEVEQALAEAYGATGVIHMSRRAATLLEPQLRISGGTLTTFLGTPVVAGAGYTTATNPSDATVTIYGTGSMVMYRGDIDTAENSIDRSVNSMSVIAQRDYLLGWDCTAVGATIELA